MFNGVYWFFYLLFVIKCKCVRYQAKKAKNAPSPFKVRVHFHITLKIFIHYNFEIYTAFNWEQYICTIFRKNLHYTVFIYYTSSYPAEF